MGSKGLKISKGPAGALEMSSVMFMMSRQTPAIPTRLECCVLQDHLQGHPPKGRAKGVAENIGLTFAMGRPPN